MSDTLCHSSAIRMSSQASTQRYCFRLPSLRNLSPNKPLAATHTTSANGLGLQLSEALTWFRVTPYRMTDPLLWSIGEAAGILGDVSRRTVQRLIERREFPVIKVGRRVMIPAQAILEWVDQKLPRRIITIARGRVCMESRMTHAIPVYDTHQMGLSLRRRKWKKS